MKQERCEGRVEAKVEGRWGWRVKQLMVLAMKPVRCEVEVERRRAVEMAGRRAIPL